MRISVTDDVVQGAPHPVTDDQVEFRRVRFITRGVFLDGHLLFYNQISLAPNLPELVDLWAEWVVQPAWRIRVGQQKIPFTRHRMVQTYRDLPLVDWDITSVAFGAERQIGASVQTPGKSCPSRRSTSGST